MDSGDQNSGLTQLLQQVRVLDTVSETDRIADVLLENNQIKAIHPQITDYPSSTEVKDAHGLIFAPGLVDLYSHSGEPGWEERETLISLGESALAGGFTRVGILPDTQPPLDAPATIEWLKRFTPSHAPKFHFWADLTVGGKGEQMTELGELAATGIVGFTDGQPLGNLGLLHQVLTYVQPLGKPVALSLGDRALSKNGVMREGKLSLKTGLPGNPAVSETAALAAILELVAVIPTPVHLMGVSTARSVELIADGKARGLPITASTTWMHLILNTAAITTYDPNLNICPPLGDRSDQLALITAVKSGIIDAIAVNHTPYTYEEKTVAFADTPPGAIGLELALPLLWQTFVETGEWTALELWQALSASPQTCLNLPPLRCTVGETTEAILFDPKKTWTVCKSNLKSLSTNTPWFGKQITGQVVDRFFNDVK
ncbi:dihydroorotase [Dactylococcopsis salina]|uniref:Dihydroorotase, multifunctional complex type n=1 Tax=Dactylococcopsis salina (strain PCC 8305) TaxID=13035 RepID=K9YRX4_DACS8|nr:dihydroorotase [Dactylococcopsis salina]AFZ49649.1 dihydroorotase, multifunctional complex type [Dactylococcopsis salina PCC 8305]